MEQWHHIWSYLFCCKKKLAPLAISPQIWGYRYDRHCHKRSSSKRSWVRNCRGEKVSLQFSGGNSTYNWHRCSKNEQIAVKICFKWTKSGSELPKKLAKTQLNGVKVRKNLIKWNQKLKVELLSTIFRGNSTSNWQGLLTFWPH